MTKPDKDATADAGTASKADGWKQITKWDRDTWILFAHVFIMFVVWLVYTLGVWEVIKW